MTQENLIPQTSPNADTYPRYPRLLTPTDHRTRMHNCAAQTAQTAAQALARERAHVLQSAVSQALRELQGLAPTDIQDGRGSAAHAPPARFRFDKPLPGAEGEKPRSDPPTSTRDSSTGTDEQGASAWAAAATPQRKTRDSSTGSDERGARAPAVRPRGPLAGLGAAPLRSGAHTDPAPKGSRWPPATGRSQGAAADGRQRDAGTQMPQTVATQTLSRPRPLAGPRAPSTPYNRAPLAKQTPTNFTGLQFGAGRRAAAEERRGRRWGRREAATQTPCDARALWWKDKMSATVHEAHTQTGPHTEAPPWRGGGVARAAQPQKPRKWAAYDSDSQVLPPKTRVPRHKSR